MTLMQRWGALLLSCVVAGCGPTDDVTVIKLAHGLDVMHPVHQAMVLMAGRARDASDGALRIDIYPSEQLGTERQALELLQIGSLGMTKVSAAVLENFAPSFRALSVPYVFRNEEHQFQVLDGEIGQSMLRGLEPFRLRGLCFYDAGSRSFYATRPIRTPDDLDGLKIRTQESPTAMQMVNALGGSATPIPWGELYTSLQQGVVDGAENNAPSFYLSGHYEVARYYSLNEHTRVPDVLLIGTHTWNRLDEQERRWLEDAVRESAVRQRELWQQATREALDAVREAGVEVVQPDPAPFADRVESLVASYAAEPQVYELIQAIRDAGP